MCKVGADWTPTLIHPGTAPTAIIFRRDTPPWIVWREDCLHEGKVLLFPLKKPIHSIASAKLSLVETSICPVFSIASRLNGDVQLFPSPIMKGSQRILVCLTRRLPCYPDMSGTS